MVEAGGERRGERNGGEEGGRGRGERKGGKEGGRGGGGGGTRGTCPYIVLWEHSPLIGIDDCPINEEEMWPVHTGY